MWNQIGGTLSNSMAQAMGRFASLLPGILAFLVAVVLFSLIGWLLAWVLRRILIAFRFDERMGRGTEAVTEWSPRQTPAGLAARLLFWVFVVTGIAVGADAFGASSHSSLADGLLAYLPKLMGAGVILLVGNIVARFLSRGVLIGAVNMNLQYARLLAWVLWRILIAFRFDDRMGRGTEAVTEWSPRQTPAGLAARLLFWVFVVTGIAVGADAFGASSHSSLADGLLAYLPKLMGAGVILLVGNIVARFLSRGVLIGAVNMNLQYARLLSLGVKWLVLVLTAAMALDHLQIGQKIVDIAFAILFGGIVLSLALSVGLGSRDLVSRSIERETSRAAAAPAQEEEQLRHF